MLYTIPRGQSSDHHAFAHLLAVFSTNFLPMTNHMDINKTIDLFIENFISKDKRERSEVDLKDFNKRPKFTNRLNHEWDEILDMRIISKIPSEADEFEYVKKELKIKDAELCYVISNYDDLDGQILEFTKAFEKVYGKGLGSIIINSTGDKMYLETEQEQGAPPRFIGKRLDNH
jgi:hypothetical protein